MRTLDMQQTANFLEDAAACEPPISDGHRTIVFGIDARGNEFVCINDALTGISKVSKL